MDLLVLNDDSKSFGGIKALDLVSFSVAENEVLGIIGLNGSGKTTAVNVVTGFVEPDSGHVWFKGKEITGFPPHRIAALGIARSFQTVRPFHNLPAFKNLIVPLYSPRIRKFTESGRWGDRDAVALGQIVGEGLDIHRIGISSKRSASNGTPTFPTSRPPLFLTAISADSSSPAAWR